MISSLYFLLAQTSCLLEIKHQVWENFSLTMDRIPLDAKERQILGKKVKKLRKEGIVPGHVYGKGLEVEHVSVDGRQLLHIFSKTGETGLVDLKIGAEKIRPVLIRGMQYDPLTGKLLHVDFYQVNLTQKVKVPVPVEIIGEEPELVHMGEGVILQTIHEIEVEALPTDLVEKIEVDISNLAAIDDAITVSQLNIDTSKLTVALDQEEIVVKLAPAVTEEMKKLLEEQEAEAAAAAAAEEGVAPEGEAPVEGEAAEGVETGEIPTESGEVPAEGEGSGSEASAKDQKPQE